MYCKYCGKEINENAEFCIHCGSKLKGETNLLISRPGKIMGCAVKLGVVINGNEMALKAGETINVYLNEGPNKIVYRIWCRRDKEVTINVEPGKKYTLIFKYDPLWGGFKVSKKSILN